MQVNDWTDRTALLQAFYNAQANLEAVRREREVIGRMLERASKALDDAELALESASVTR